MPEQGEGDGKVAQNTMESPSKKAILILFSSSKEIKHIGEGDGYLRGSHLLNGLFLRGF
jgi:hypothetical protein